MSESWQDLVERFGYDVPLARGALAATQQEFPKISSESCLARLDDWADRVQNLNLPKLEALHQILFDELGFDGNREDYYRPENSLLPHVMETRLGLPLTLSVVYVEVAERVGLAASGVAFPAHFLVKVEGEAATFVDPFHRGLRRTEDELPELLEQVLGNPTPIEPWMVRPARNADVLLRLLANLKLAYVRKNDLPDAITAIDRMLVLRPEDMNLLQERGTLYARIGLFTAAAKDLETVLAAGVPDMEAARLKDLIPRLRASAKTLN